MTKELKAAYVLDSSGVTRGRAQAEKEMAGLDSSAKKMGDSFDKHTSRIGGMFSGLSTMLGNFGVPFTGSLDKVSSSLDRAKSTGQGYGQALSDVGGVAAGALAGGLVVAGGAAIRMAGNFEESMTQLVTGAGESEANLKTVSSGILALAPKVGESTSQLTSGLYMIESAGHHGAAGLQILQAAAQGAKVGNADLGTVADAVTTLMNDYHEPASKAADITSKLVATVASGKTHMQDLASSLAVVAPIAAAAGVSMDQVLGAMATMTSQGTPAADAATHLKQTIANLSNPLPKARNEMAALGLNANDVASKLGQRGLTGTFDILTAAIAKHTAGGEVMIDQLKKGAAAGSGWQSKLAAMTPAQQAQIKTLTGQGVAMEKYQEQLASLSPAQQQLVKEMASGQTGTKAFKDAWASLSGPQRDQISQMAAGAEAFNKYQAQVKALPSAYQDVLRGSIASKEGFVDLNTTLQKLPPDEQTQVAALADMVGGTRSMQAALELTGGNAETFAGNVQHISKTTADAKGNVQGWALTQKDFNQKLDEAKASAETLGIKFGTFLIPKVEDLMNKTEEVVVWFDRHKDAAYALAAVVGGVLTVAIGAFTVNKIAGMIDGVKNAGKALSDFASGVEGVASKVLGHFGDISGGAGKMAGDVSGQASEMETNVSRSASSMGGQVENTVSGMEANATRSAGTMNTQISQSASSMESSVSGDTASMATKTEASMTGMATTTEATMTGMEATVTGDAAGMARGVEGDMTGMAVKSEATVGGMATAVDGELAGMAAAGEASLAGLVGGIAAVGGGLAGIAGIVGYGMYLGANPSAISTGAAYSSGFGFRAAPPNVGGGGYANFNTSGGALGLNNLQLGASPALSQLAGGLGSLSGLPHAAAGALVDRPTLLVAGEAGREAIVPLDGISLDQPAGLGPLGAPGGGSMGGTWNVNVTVSGLVTGTAQQVADALTPALRQSLMFYSQMAGTSGLTL